MFSFLLSFLGPWGMAIGMMIDFVLAATTVEVGRVKEVAQLKVDPGEPIYDIYGDVQVAGTVIYAQPIQERVETRKEGDIAGLGGTTIKEYFYYGKVAVSLGRKIQGIKRIWFDNKVVYERFGGTTSNIDDSSGFVITSNTDNTLFGLRREKEEKNFKFTVYTGGENQPVDPWLKELEADTPAYKDLAYIVFDFDDLYDYGNRYPAVKVECFNYKEDYDPALYIKKVETKSWRLDGKSQKDLSEVLDDPRCNAKYNGEIMPQRLLAGRVDMSNAEPSIYLTSNDRFHGDLNLNGELVKYPNFTTPYGFLEGMLLGESFNNEFYGERLVVLASTKDTIAFYKAEDGAIVIRDKERRKTIVSKSGLSYELIGFCFQDSESFGFFYVDNEVDTDAIYFQSVTLKAGGEYVFDEHYEIFSEYDNNNGTRPPSTSNRLYSLMGSAEGVVCREKGVPFFYYLDSDAGGSVNIYKISDHVLFDSGNASKEYIDREKSNRGSSFTAFAQDGFLYVFSYESVDQGAEEYIVLNKYTRLEEGSGDHEKMSLGYIIQDLCKQANYSSDDIDITSIDKIAVPGYVRDRNTSIKEVLKDLMIAYQFDVVSKGWSLEFKKRKGEVVAEIPLEDVIFKDKKRFSDAISSAEEIPTELEIAYKSKDIDYEVSSQYSRVTFASHTKKQQVGLPLVLTDNQAAQISEIVLTAMWRERNNYEFAVPMKYIYLEVGDVVRVAEKTMRITQSEFSKNGIIEIKAVADSASIYESNKQGVGSEETEARKPEENGLPLVIPLDIPSKTPNLDAPSITLAAYSTKENFSGSAVVMSTDLGDSYQTIANPGSQATVGITTNILQNANPYIFDDESSLTVRVQPWQSLSSITDEEMIAGKNMAAIGKPGRYEIIQFKDVQDNLDGTWTLTKLLRGRLGTEHLIDTHANKDIFVLLDDNVIEVPLDASLLEQDLLFNAKLPGKPIEESTSETITFKGLSSKPLDVVNIEVVDEDDGSKTVNFTPRVLVGGEWKQGAEVDISHLRYIVEIEDEQGQLIDELNLEQPTFNYSGATPATAKISVFNGRRLSREKGVSL
ncbi:hypothetical protein CWI73_03770 [Idiomarina piscisalsi]|uniref:Uncharacterized protein n=2 Tax=Idiomarina piscisalsi TaxID=1096243 RepID=A0A432YXC0_9GAMM|nr:hypothetical protein CWI73_03770 [Idiomarina piscisalsi]